MGGETIDSTTNHPYFVVGYGYVDAGNLIEGDTVLLANGKEAKVEKVEIEFLTEPVMVYTFEVKDWHCYFVGETGVLVHNATVNCTKSVDTGNAGVGNSQKNANDTASQHTEMVLPSKPHTNGTQGHWETIVKEAEKMEASGEYSKIYINKGISNEIAGANPNRRPDIMAVRYDGLIDQVEVPSKTDTYDKLISRMMDNQKIFGQRAGNIKVKKIGE